MLSLAAIPLTCWLCALLAIPRPPRPGDEIQELVYRRLIGRHLLLRACATASTLIAILALVLHALIRVRA